MKKAKQQTGAILFCLALASFVAIKADLRFKNVEFFIAEQKVAEKRLYK